MRFHLSIALAAALSVTSVVSASAGSLVAPEVEGETMVAPEEPAGSMGSLGGGAVVGLIALLALAAAAGGGGSSTPGT